VAWREFRKILWQKEAMLTSLVLRELAQFSSLNDVAMQFAAAWWA
jgi:hypothetical protein